MTLIPVGSEGTYEGTLKIENTRIKDAPAIAALLNAISVVGLINELAGQGILFSTVEARFRLDPQRLTLYQGSAEGASMGLSMDGTYDFEAEKLGHARSRLPGLRPECARQYPDTARRRSSGLQLSADGAGRIAPCPGEPVVGAGTGHVPRYLPRRAARRPQQATARQGDGTQGPAGGDR
ncbi:hypothetical protein ACFOHS_09880 [Jhaorihella thermophila]